MYNTSIRAFALSVTVCSMGAGLIGCAEEEAARPMPTDEALKAPPALNEASMPSFLRPPHVFDKASGTAEKISSGYRYAQGQFDANTYYGIYSYVDADWSYMSTSVWSSDSSSLTNGMDVSATGDIWLQSGSYFIEADGSAVGEYATAYHSKDGYGTEYLTDFTSSATMAHYRSTIDHTNTAAHPDCVYISDWASDRSTSSQSCERDDASYWQCDYSYTYSPAYGAGGELESVGYRSTQACDDSMTAYSDYSYVDDMEWNYLTGQYTDHAVLSCFEPGDLQRMFTYEYADGMGQWYDENMLPIDYPTCGWTQGGATY